MPKSVAAVALEHVPFLEGIGVEQELDPLAGGELALGVLRVDALLAAAQPGGRSLFVKLADDIEHEAPRRFGTASIRGTGARARQKCPGCCATVALSVQSPFLGLSRYPRSRYAATAGV